MALQRGPVPKFLGENYRKWGKRFAKRLATHKKAVFNWPTYRKQNVGLLLRRLLIELSFNHCAYCDGYPLGETSLQTLDHFRPKSRFPLLALVWHNLFLCCDICQNAKREHFERRLLKPDRKDYLFDTYFMIDFRAGKLMPNPSASMVDQDRAAYTIALLDLNRRERCKSRLAHLSLNRQDYQLEDLPYRYLYR